MKTRILSALLAILMLASLASCSAKPERGSISDEETKPTAEDTKADGVEYALPERSGNTYSSKSLGAKMTIDEGWVFSTDEEIAELNNIVLDAAGDNYVESLKKADMFYDMMAANETTGDNISVVFQNMGLIYGKVITAETYLNLSKTSVEDMLTEMGAENIESSIEKVQFAGKEEAALIVKSEISDMPIYQICIAKSCGDYMANVTITTMLEDSTADILAKFTPVD